MKNKRVLVLGGGGFIGANLVKRLKRLGNHIVAIDLNYPQFSASYADQFIQADLRDERILTEALSKSYDFIFQLAADMGGAGYIFTGDNDADIMASSSKINLNLLSAAVKNRFKGTIFYASSACVYPEYNQMDPDSPNCEESSAYPAQPDSEYGWEKLFSERLFMSFQRNYGIQTRIARFHNVYGPEGVYEGGKEKAPAAICRKIIEAPTNGTVEVWGDGKQTRSFLFIDDCLDAMIKLIQSSCKEPLNIGSEEMVTINQLVELTIAISGKNAKILHIEGPQGVRGRCSNNLKVTQAIGWSPEISLNDGIKMTYAWISDQMHKNH
jgi:nucleoside-diphosphate-sugar epimerase